MDLVLDYGQCRTRLVRLQASSLEQLQGSRSVARIADSPAGAEV
jgi:hypothetical protein